MTESGKSHIVRICCTNIFVQLYCRIQLGIWKYSNLTFVKAFAGSDVRKFVVKTKKYQPKASGCVRAHQPCGVHTYWRDFVQIILKHNKFLYAGVSGVGLTCSIATKYGYFPY